MIQKTDKKFNYGANIFSIDVGRSLEKSDTILNVSFEAL